jgi:hypothetical protein
MVLVQTVAPWYQHGLYRMATKIWCDPEGEFSAISSAEFTVIVVAFTMLHTGLFRRWRMIPGMWCVRTNTILQALES